MADKKFRPSLSYLVAIRRKSLSLQKSILDKVAFPVASLIICDLAFAVGSARNHRPRPLLAKRFPKRVCIIALVGDEMLRPVEFIQQQFGCSQIADVAGRELECEWTTDHICQDMKFAGLAASRRTDALRLRPPLPPKAERCAFT